MNKLQPAKLRKMFHDAQLLVKDYDNLVNEARNPPKKEHVVWEVYAGRGRVTEQVNMLSGCRGERFSIKDGWNFDNPKDRKRFIQKLVREEPDDVMISPSCRLWSSLQELTANRSDEARKYLVEARARDHENHLVFVATVYMIQYRAGRHATLEHPWGSRAWNTKALSKLVGYDTYIDQCMLGLELEDIDGVVRPVKKPTGLKTTRKNLYETMGLFACDGQHHHTHLEGYIPGQGKRSKLAEDYPYEMARNLAWCLTRGEDSIDEIKAAEEAAQELAGVDEHREEDQRGAEQETIKANRQLRKEVSGRAVDYVARLHKNLGHPSAKTLIKMLQEVQATSDVVIAAERYVCAQCFNRQKPSQVPPSSGISSTTFNNRVVCDSAWIQLGPDRQCVLTLCDEATRYIAVRILNSEKSTEFIKGVERAWVRHFGVPRYLRVDSAKGWESRAVRDWCSDHGVILEVAPAESHNWLGVVERRHQVVRRALEIYMEDEGEANLTNLKEAAIYVPPRINQMSLTQWVLGRAPAQELSLTAELYNPGIDAMDEQTHFALIQDRRLRAGQAFLRADSDAKLRRAMNQKYYESKDRVLVGQRCWYWRIQGSGHLQKSKWRGPARCVAAELSEDGSKPVVQWLVHGTSLLRCSPAHVRPMVEDTKAFPVVNPRDALEALEEIRARSTTQFRDLAKDMEELDPILEDLVEPDGAPPNPFPLPDDDDDLPERMESDGRSLNFGSDYEPSIAPPAEDEGDGPAVPGIVSMMIPEALRSEERERTPRRRAAGEETEAAEPSLPQPQHEAPGVEDGEESPSKRPRMEDDLVPETPHDDDELVVDNINFVDSKDNSIPEGWVCVGEEIMLDDVWAAANLTKGPLRKNEVNPRELTVSERELVVKGKMKELQTFFSNNVWEFAKPGDLNKNKDRVITARWVLTWKTSPEGNPVAKARLVLRGFQDPDLFNLEKASPTAARLGKLAMLSLASTMKWSVFCGDVKAAFLSGAEFVRKILVKLPKDCGPLLGVTGGNDTHMRLLKGAYGLADAPLLWFKEATRRLVALNLKPQQLDKCTFCYYEKNRLAGMLILHVDDMLIAGDMTTTFATVVDKLKENFEFGKWEQLTEGHAVTYCGSVLEKKKDMMTMSFEAYLKKICPVTITKGRDPKAALNDGEKTRSRGLLGALQWPGGQGLPALMASTSLLAGDLPTGDSEVMTSLNKALRFAKETSKYPMLFPKVADHFEELALVCFCDAAFGVRKDYHSQGGYLLVLTNKKVLHGEKCRFCCIAWRSFKLPRVCRSSLSAECQAMASALEEMLMAKVFLQMALNKGVTLQETQKKEMVWPVRSLQIAELFTI